MFQFKFKRSQISKIPRDEMIKELKKVAEFYKFIRFTRHDYDRVAKLCKGSSVLAEFKTWQNALDSIGIRLTPKKVDCNIIHIKELFDEMERIWKLLGHRPSKIEWDLSKPKYSYSTYKQRFNGWVNACLKFIEYKMGKPVSGDSNYNFGKKPSKLEIKADIKNQEKKREIPLKLRLKVMQRDNFRCSYCGKSPATSRVTVLHIDHIRPYSKGGKTTLDNLRTLCAECNWGKGKDKTFK